MCLARELSDKTHSPESGERGKAEALNAVVDMLVAMSRAGAGGLLLVAAAPRQEQIREEEAAAAASDGGDAQSEHATSDGGGGGGAGSGGGGAGSGGGVPASRVDGRPISVGLAGQELALVTCWCFSVLLVAPPRLGNGPAFYADDVKHWCVPWQGLRSLAHVLTQWVGFVVVKARWASMLSGGASGRGREARRPKTE